MPKSTLCLGSFCLNGWGIKGRENQTESWPSLKVTHPGTDGISGNIYVLGENNQEQRQFSQSFNLGCEATHGYH